MLRGRVKGVKGADLEVESHHWLLTPNKGAIRRADVQKGGDDARKHMIWEKRAAHCETKAQRVMLVGARNSITIQSLFHMVPEAKKVEVVRDKGSGRLRFVVLGFGAEADARRMHDQQDDMSKACRKEGFKIEVAHSRKVQSSCKWVVQVMYNPRKIVNKKD